MTRLIALGDSIFAGWDGHVNLPHDQRIPEIIGKINNWDVTNKSIGGTQFSGNNSFDRFTAETNFFAYDVVLVGYGVNDWCYPPGSLNDERDYIQQGINNIHNTNAKIPILFELPTQDFRKESTSLDDKNSGGWTQNQLCDLIAEVATKNGCKYYDWRTDPLITLANHTTTLGDSEVHPTQTIMDKMAQRLAPILKSMISEDSHPIVPTNPDKTDNGSKDEDKSEDKNKDDTSKHVKALCHLDKADDLFKIGDNLNSNVQKIIDFINGIYKRISALFGLDSVSVALETNYSNDLLRPLRNGVISTLFELQNIINELIKYCNRYGFIDELTGDTSLINLNPPRCLNLDKEHYEQPLNKQWQTIEDTLNKLSGYVEEMEGVE